MIDINLKVVPHGLIESGQVGITVDPSTGLVTELSTAVVGVSFFNKTLSDDEVVKIDPNALIAKNFKPGMQWIIGPVKINVVSIADGTATANISVVSPDYNLTGNADLDVTGQYIGIQHVVMNGTVDADGMTSNVILELVPC